MAGVDRRDFELDRPDRTTHNVIDPSWYDWSPPGADLNRMTDLHGSVIGWAPPEAVRLKPTTCCSNENADNPVWESSAQNGDGLGRNTLLRQARTQSPLILGQRIPSSANEVQVSPTMM
jgi:hypothetical protein